MACLYRQTAHNPHINSTAGLTPEELWHGGLACANEGFDDCVDRVAGPWRGGITEPYRNGSAHAETASAMDGLSTESMYDLL